ncbi:DUF4858 domain-containing protein [Bacteroides sp. 519]|uniref:DUF4858 domain-containing protein n=1 Tax=Bacteroides sp. 519 TaxID=2302937 RepID=UPI0013D48CEE|nr:DUF4858 domain-containing protein [Bacteroides sp. 519]NDV59806.1 DUF4858 domain-containing protein [Bacteroides sp. 519]
MYKHLNLFFFVCTVTVFAHAQWSPKDSLNLRRILDGDGEIKLNPNAVKQIDFGSFVGTPLMSTDKPALQYDTSLPYAPKKADIVLTTQPYTALTKFNYDPIYKRKIKVGPNTWRNDTLPRAIYLRRYTNWADHPFAKGNRQSLEEIEASGLRYNPIGERANNQPVGTWRPVPGASRVTTHMSGFTVGGLDFNAVFTREFWDKSIERRRNRTLEVLKNYGDSTTVLYNEEIRKTKIP